MRAKPILLQAASRILPESEALRVVKSFDVIGDIAVTRLPAELGDKRFILAEALLGELKNVKVVLNQSSPVLGEYRTRGLEWLAGEKRTETIHKEHGCLMKVDVAQAYFSPRLAYERIRIAELVKKGETVVNMFCGVGSFSIIIARKAKPSKVYSIDLNPEAIRYLKENIALNKLGDIVIPILGDAREIIASQFSNIADRVLMPLPAKAYEYIDDALRTLKNGKGIIHYYDFVHTSKNENPIQKVAEKVEDKLAGRPFRVEYGRIVRATGPNWYQVALDIRIGEDNSRDAQSLGKVA